MPEPLRGSTIRHIGWRAIIMAHGVQLGRREQAVLVAIASHADQRGHCWPTRDLLAAEAKVTARSVTAAVHELEWLGVLTVERRGWNRPNVYVIHANAIAALPRVVVVAADGRERGEASSPPEGKFSTERGEASSRPGGSQFTLTAQGTAQRNGSPLPPAAGGACESSGDVLGSGVGGNHGHDRRATTPAIIRRGHRAGKKSGDAGGTGNEHTISEPEDPRLWLDLFNRATGTGLRSDDPANLRAIRRCIEKHYTLADAERVVTWAATTWPETARGNFLRPSTVFGGKFAEYNETAKLATHGQQPNEWDVPTPTLLVQRDDS